MPNSLAVSLMYSAIDGPSAIAFGCAQSRKVGMSESDRIPG